MAKRGPKPCIGPDQEKEILACLTVGASLKDAAAYIGVDYASLYRKRKNDLKFANRLIQAVSKGKLHHLNKIGKAPQWQASAFMLERKWHREYGRKDKVQQEHTGANGGPIRSETAVKHSLDYGQLARDIEQFAIDRAAERISANGNGESVHSN